MSPKSLAMAVALAAFALPATAWSFKLQKPEMTQQGTFTFGGNLGISALTLVVEPKGGDESEASVTTIAIAPQIGYFVMNGLEIGALLDYHSTTTEPEGGDELETSGFGIGAYVAYYFPWLEGNAMYPYIGASARYLSETPGEDTEASGYDLRPGVGLMLAIGSRTGGFMKLDVAYQIRSMTTEVDGDETDTSDTSGLAIGLGFGLYIH